MKTRQRMTWAASSRQAAAAPAIPGYGVEDQDHPAHTQEDPEATDYMIGGPSEFAEDVHPGPYGDSGRPALPGVGVEDQDHPAHKGQVGRQASLMELVRRKSAKCLTLARKVLPKTASWSEIEDQAFAFMDMADDQLDASLGRFSGDFLAEEAPAEEPPVVAEDDVMARLHALEDEMLALKRAASGKKSNQNDPAGQTLGASGKTEEQEKAEEKAISNEHSPAPNMKAAAAWGALFDSFDHDRDGFVTAEDWGGPRSIFAKFDTDKDGIIARHEVLAKAAEDDDEGEESEDDEGGDEKESGKKASGKKGGEMPPQFKENAEKKKEEAEAKKDEGEDKKDEGKESGKKSAKKAEDDEPEAKESGKKAKKAEGDEDEKKGGKKASNHKESFGHFADLDDDELEMLNAMQYGDGDEGVTGCGEPMAAKTAEDEGEEAKEGEDEGEGEESDKEASVAEFFTSGFDPMGLADGTVLTAEDEAAFAEVFGKTAEDEGEESEDEGDEKESGKKANVRTASARTPLRPQPRKPTQGARQIGTVSRTASTRGGEVDELSKLWHSDPDVSGAFG